jgi:shikimate kinase / 3-dehydroquinate synthase
VEAVAREGAAGAGSRAGRRAIVFAGFMGAGKTSAARAVAAELGTEALDVDRELEREFGESIESFFDREGEQAFRIREEEIVLGLLARPGARVIALGGGSLGSDRVREALREHLVVHLDVSTEDAWRRASGKGRPLARDPDRFRELHEQRRAQFDAAADALLPPSDRGVAARALPALLALRDAPSGTRLVWGRGGSDEYAVFMARGLLASGFFWPREGRRFAITDENVQRVHSIEADWRYAIAAGEGHKTLATVEAALRAMASAGVARADLVAAVGGGVVGDVAGFCAAVYQRGIRHVQVPTTLVAQVDSAYGGKTGVDLPEGKNYAGAYHQPSAVLVDPTVLETLPPGERAAGYPEVVKTALIAGGSLWARVRQGGDPDEEIILGCIRTKLSVVSEDERDEGRRQVLNLGHTVAHAIEAATGYSRYRHGEAVAVGLMCALRLSGRDALRREVAELLSAHGLPLRFEGADPERVLELIGRDKKRRDASVPFVLVDAPGEVTPGHEVPEAELRAALEEAHGG